MAVAGPLMLLPHLGAACRDARREHGRKIIHVAVRLDVGENTVRGFEMGRQWPRNPDATIQAYAEELDLEPIVLWEEALRRWRSSGGASL